MLLFKWGYLYLFYLVIFVANNLFVRFFGNNILTRNVRNVRRMCFLCTIVYALFENIVYFSWFICLNRVYNEISVNKRKPS